MIEVRGLRKEYGTTVAVDGIDLDVAEGEILGVLGANGSGKTTTVECVAGLRRPDAGTVRVAGLDPAADRPALTRLVGVQLQQAGLPAKMTAREAIELYASFYDDPVDGVALAERMGLGPKLESRYRDLSGGQQQRLAVTLALVGRPQVALLDELSTGLDPASRRHVWREVEALRDRGCTVVLVTHLMEEAQHLCDRLAVLDRGRVVAIDTTDGIVGRTAAPTVMTFTPSAPVDHDELAAIDGVAGVRNHPPAGVEVALTDEAVLAVLDRLAQRGVRPERLRVTGSTLDDAYLRLVGAPQGGDDAIDTDDEEG